jgi:hypothetical protein
MGPKRQKIIVSCQAKTLGWSKIEIKRYANETGYLYTYIIFSSDTHFFRMVTLVTNICLLYTLYINRCFIMWCCSEHSAQISLLVLWWYCCSRSVKVCFESICCSFWRSTEWSIADICFDLTGSMNLWSLLFLQYLWWCFAVNRYT